MSWRSPTSALLVVLLMAAAACIGSTTPAGSRSPGSSGAVATPVGSQPPAATMDSTGGPEELLEHARMTLDAPGAMAVLTRSGTRIFLSTGTADQAGADLDETTRFRIASITKPIIAALVLDAVARGEVSLDDVVGELVPGVVRATPVITVRQLLDHTSGMFDEGNDGYPVADIEQLADPAIREEARGLLAKYRAGEDIVTPAPVIIALAETHERYFPPGEGYHYSNVGYQIVGMVLEAVTGQPLAELLRSRIVEPLGLRHTTIAPPDTGSPEMRGYVRAAADSAPVDVTDDLSWFGNGGNGGILTTPDELQAILKAIVTARLFPVSLVAEMEKPDRESYGLGLATYILSCGTFYGHGGLVNGTQSMALVSADGSDGVVIALNLTGTRDPGLVQLAEQMLCQVQ